jgi:esterase/lipase
MAGPSKKEINDIKKALKEIEQLYDKLGGSNPFSGVDPKSIAASADETKRLKEELQEAREAVTDLEGESGDLFKNWKAISNEVRGYRKVINDSKGTVSKVNDLAQKLRDHQSKTNQLSSKELNSLKSKLEQQRSILISNQDSLRSQIEELHLKKQSGVITATELNQLRESENIYRNITDGLNENNGLLNEIIGKTKQEADLRKDIEKKLGATGGILRGMSKIPLIADLVDTEKILKAAEDEIELTNNGVKGLGAGFKAMKGQIISGLLNPANLALGAITLLVEALITSDKSAGDLAKEFNITYSEALNTRRELGEIAALSGDAALNTRALQETLVAVGSQLGSNAKLNEADLKTFTKLREQAGYTNEELYGVQQLSLVNGKSLEENTKEILGGANAYASRNKLVLNEKQILKDVSKASASLKLTLGGSAEAVAEAAAKARQFGVNLEQAEKISQSLLDFESSIENELSAELLIGRDLNLERARGLALNGDIAGATEEIAKQVGTSADFAQMNVIQQEALAKAAGMTRDELAQSLMDREALAKLSEVEGKTAQEKFNNLVKEVGLEEAKKRLGNEQLANQFQQQSVQERFAQAVEKLKEVFVQIAEPILAIVSPLANIASSVLPLINVALQPIIWAFQTIGDAVSGLFTWLSESKGVLITLGSLATGLYVAMNGAAIAAGAIEAKKKLSLMWDERSLIIEKGKQTIDAVRLGYQTAMGSLAAREALMQKKGLALSIGKAVMNVVASLASIPVVGWALGLAAAGTVAALGYSFMQGNDVFSPGEGSSGYGKRTLFGPEGAIQLNNKDTVIAGTNLFGDDIASEPGKPTEMMGAGEIKVASPQSPGVNMEPTNALLRQLISAVQQGGVVTLDGQKVGEALKIGTYKTQ